MYTLDVRADCIIWFNFDGTTFREKKKRIYNLCKANHIGMGYQLYF